MSACACEPGRGYEPGAGWERARAAAQEHDVWVLTHGTNEAPVREALLPTRHSPLGCTLCSCARLAGVLPCIGAVHCASSTTRSGSL